MTNFSEKTQFILESFQRDRGETPAVSEEYNEVKAVLKDVVRYKIMNEQSMPTAEQRRRGLLQQMQGMDLISPDPGGQVDFSRSNLPTIGGQTEAQYRAGLARERQRLRDVRQARLSPDPSSTLGQLQAAVDRAGLVAGVASLPAAAKAIARGLKQGGQRLAQGLDDLNLSPTVGGEVRLGSNLGNLGRGRGPLRSADVPDTAGSGGAPRPPKPDDFDDFADFVDALNKYNTPTPKPTPSTKPADVYGPTKPSPAPETTAPKPVDTPETTAPKPTKTPETTAPKPAETPETTKWTPSVQKMDKDPAKLVDELVQRRISGEMPAGGRGEKTGGILSSLRRPLEGISRTEMDQIKNYIKDLRQTGYAPPLSKEKRTLLQRVSDFIGGTTPRTSHVERSAALNELERLRDLGFRGTDPTIRFNPLKSYTGRGGGPIDISPSQLGIPGRFVGLRPETVGSLDVPRSVLRTTQSVLAPAVTLGTLAQRYRSDSEQGKSYGEIFSDPTFYSPVGTRKISRGILDYIVKPSASAMTDIGVDIGASAIEDITAGTKAQTKRKEDLEAETEERIKKYMEKNPNLSYAQAAFAVQDGADKE